MPIILALIVVLLIVVAGIATYRTWELRKSRGPHGPPEPPGPKPQTPESKLVMSYLKALYPQSGYAGVESLTSDEVLQLYDSLDWYYLPLVREVEQSRRGPVKGPYADASTQWFMADGADCGDYSPTPGNFTCSVFGGACETWEWGGKSGKGRPYQYACMIKPYGRRGGAPNNAYIECVAFVCESLGRMLLTAGPGKNSCNYTAPTWQQFLRNANAGLTTDWPTNVKPVKGSFTSRASGAATPTAHNLSEVHCGWSAGDSPVPLDDGTRVWGPVGGFDGAMSRRVAGHGDSAGGAVEHFGKFGDWGPSVNPFEEDFLAGDPRSGDAERENLSRPAASLGGADAGAGGPLTAAGFQSNSCPSKTSCSSGSEHNAPGCKITSGSMSDICCWDYSTGQPVDSVCPWPMTCMATQDPGSQQVWSNYCAVPCGYQGCDVTQPLGSGGCDWFVGGTPWRDWLKAQKQPYSSSAAWDIVKSLQNSKPAIGGNGGSFVGSVSSDPRRLWPRADLVGDVRREIRKAGKHLPGGWSQRTHSAQPKPHSAHPSAHAQATAVFGDGTTSPLPPPRADATAPKTMFYWCKGYGKFLNMGKTGVYFQYFHFLLTAPRFAADGKTPIRWSFPQVLQTATMAGGNSELATQLADLMSGQYYDERKYLQGYVTTLRGKDYEGYHKTPGDGDDIAPVSNTMPFETENVGGLFNPRDDDNLLEVDNLTVTKYYDPDSYILNPQYKQRIRFSPYEAVYLLQGMHIYGATANSTEAPFVTMSGRKPGSYGAGVFPFGVHFAGSNLGHCVYQLTKLCGWDSSQFTQMPTGAGGKKYCNSPEYDYEIVYIDDKSDACYYDFKMLDPVQDWQNYVDYGFVQGTGDEDRDKKLLYVEYFDAQQMRLTERNVPDDWKGPFPNAAAYDQPKEFIPDTSWCPYSDEVMNPWAKSHGGGANPFWYRGS